MNERNCPTDDFVNTVDTARLTNAVYVAVTASGVAFTATNNRTGAAVNFVTGGQWYPIQTRAALGGAAGCTIVYAY